MNKLILVLIAAAAVIGTTIYVLHKQSGNTFLFNKQDVPVPAYDAWIHWKNAHGKRYSPAEENRKLAIWYANYQKIMNHNLRNDKPYSLGFNGFMDLTTEEFKATYLGLITKTSYNPVHLDTTSNAATVDWRNKGAVTDVKNQGQCGSCWAFSTTGGLEGAHYLSTGTLTSFSEQQLVDCSGSYGNMGCNGGLMDYAFKYVEDHGITTESKYPYTAVTGSCETKQGVWTISSYHDVTKGSDSQLKAAVTKQPVSVAVDAEAW
jgi:cathepsin L